MRPYFFFTFLFCYIIKKHYALQRFFHHNLGISEKSWIGLVVIRALFCNVDFAI